MNQGGDRQDPMGINNPSNWNNNNGMNPSGGGNPLDFNDRQMGRDYVMMEEETAAVSLSRKYGYAIMALSVVVLAVLMVRKKELIASSSEGVHERRKRNKHFRFSTYVEP